jgi:hypothetical protein
MTVREERATKVRELRDEGLTYRAIAAHTGMAKSTISSLLTDPDGSKLKARKDSYRGICACGARTDGSAGPGRSPTRCTRCARAYAHDTRYWTRERVLARLGAYIESHGGVPPSAMHWTTISVGDGGVPLPTIRREFGSWKAALEACGLEAFASGNYGRAGESDELCREIRARYEAGESAYALARAYGIHPSGLEYRIRKVGGRRRTRAQAQQLRRVRRQSHPVPQEQSSLSKGSGLPCRRLRSELQEGRVMAVQTTEPTRVEVDAAERVLAEAHGWKNDGYFRELGRSVLEAVRDARMAEFVRETEVEFERRMDLVGEDHDPWDLALGEGRV